MNTHSQSQFPSMPAFVSDMIRRAARPACLYALLVLPAALSAQTNLLRIDYQWADDVEGPWTQPPASQAYVQPNGSLLTLADRPKKFFRLTIQEIDHADAETPQVEVESLRPSTRSIAESHLQWMRASLSKTGTTWSNVTLAPIAHKVFDPAYQSGEEPAYIEFKIVSDFEPAVKPAEFLVGNESAPIRDLGHILVSLHEGDAPVPQFSESGLTPCERLLQRVGSISKVRIMRFGPTFATVENEFGDLLANAGTDPFQVPPDFVAYKDQTFQGEFDSETAEEPPADGSGGPRMAARGYPDYDAFKQDYLNNPVYQLMREHKRQKVAGEWALIRGETPPAPEVLTVTPGEEIHLLPGQVIDRYFLDDDGLEEQPLAVIQPNLSGGGLLVTGLQAGITDLTVQTPEGIKHFQFNFPPLGGGTQEEFIPGWQTPQDWYVTGGYNATPRYKQTKDGHLWCPKVGCGPVAWAILLGHWDRHRGVPAAFYRNIPGDFTVSDAPFTVTEKPAHLHDVYAALHDYCDVVCETVGGAGATPPGDMIEAGATYLWLPKLVGHLGYKYSWAWDLNDPNWNEPSNRIRSSIKNGRPAIVGLGWLWHYAVAYGYRYQEFKLTPNDVYLRRRWFACNEGWAKDTGMWYSGYDTFLGASIKPWQK